MLLSYLGNALMLVKFLDAMKGEQGKLVHSQIIKILKDKQKKSKCNET